MGELKAVEATVPHRAMLEAIRMELRTQFLEREDVIDGILSVILCKQHALVLGPPGTAKSAITTAVANAITGAKYFYWLLTKFSTPEEIFGPISLAGLQQDRVKRITDGKFPWAHVSFLDEVFKANSAILNSLLTAVNERVYHNDGTAQPIPLITVVGASNELPEGDELEALFDRFLVRYWISYLHEPAHVRAIMTMTGEPTLGTSISLTDLELCSKEAMQVRVPNEVFDALLIIKARIEEQGFRASDRRWRQIVKLLKAYAYVDGCDDVSEDHFEILADALWREPKDRPQLSSIIGTVGNPLNVRAVEILDAAKELVSKMTPVESISGGADKAEWLKTASLTETQLTDMEKELTDLMARNPKRNLKKVKNVENTVKGLKKRIMQGVASLYNL